MSQSINSPLADYVERIIDLAKWGFGQRSQLFRKDSPSTAHPSGNGQYATVIYTSEYCRVMFLMEPTGIGRSFGVSVFYGRLHAPDDSFTIQWNGDSCYCWHSLERFRTLLFLDGVSSEEAERNGAKYDLFLDKFPDPPKDIDFIEFPIKRQVDIWKRYSERLFRLFDLRQPDLWIQYTQYVQMYYSIQRHRFKTVFTPSLDRIC